jgi:hypothetical protein
MLRLKVMAANYGKVVEATCPTCGTKSQAKIVRGVDENLVKNLNLAIRKALLESKDFSEAARAFYEAGLPIVDMTIFGRFAQISELMGSQPKVENEQIKIVEFSKEDQQWAKGLKIKLDD